MFDTIVRNFCRILKYQIIITLQTADSSYFKPRTIFPAFISLIAYEYPRIFNVLIPLDETLAISKFKLMEISHSDIILTACNSVSKII